MTDPPCVAFNVYRNESDPPSVGEKYCLKSSASPLVNQSQGVMRGPCQGIYLFLSRIRNDTTTSTSGLRPGAKAGVGAGPPLLTPLNRKGGP